MIALITAGMSVEEIRSRSFLGLPLVFDTSLCAYFGALIYAMFYCLSRATKVWPIVCSCGIMTVTWWYIIKFLYEFWSAQKEGAFDEAYADVVRDHWGPSFHLLTWVIVAVCWSHDARIEYNLFAFLGAASASYLIWTTNHTHRPEAPSRRGTRGKKPVSSASIPILYLFCAFLAFASTLRLPGTVDTAPEAFSFWLLCIHISLCIPKVLLPLLRAVCPISRATICDSTLGAFPTYAILLVLSFAGHAHAMWYYSTSFTHSPQTDCQLSITYDMVFCALITVYRIWLDTQSMKLALGALCVAPMISPAAVLAAYLAAGHWPEWHREGVTRIQQMLASRERASGQHGEEKQEVMMPAETWMNLGVWTKDTKDYDQACRTLATRIADVARLGPSDGVLACGCGHRGDELLFLKQRYRLEHITGIDIAATPRPCPPNVLLLKMRFEDIRTSLPHKGRYRKIIAVDSIYHCADKMRFFCDAEYLLPDGDPEACVVVSDILLKPNAPAWVSLALGLCNIPRANQWTKQEYVHRLGEAGFEIDDDAGVEFFCLEPVCHVLARWFPTTLVRWLDYSILRARKKVSSSGGSPSRGCDKKQIPKAAVVGSGLTGLAAAHCLFETHDVTIFEQNDRFGVCANSMEVGGIKIDVPPRMLVDGYWTTVLDYCEALNVNVVEMVHDQAPAFGTHWISRAWAILRAAPEWIRITRAFAQVSDALPKTRHPARSFIPTSSGLPSPECESWGQWVDRHGFNWHGLCMRTVNMNLSWILSCTYDQVKECPSTVIIDFVLRLRLFDFSELNRWPAIRRIEPSIEDLARALSYGCTAKFNTSVGTVDARSKVINGTAYDRVVICTEAIHVPKLCPQYAHIFSRFSYHSSRIVIHRDPSFMPRNRKHWLSLSVRPGRSGGEGESQPDHGDRKGNPQDMSELNMWLCKWLGKEELGEQLFETWNPHHEPKKELVIRDYSLHRVVHTAKNVEVFSEIEHIQGKDGIYFAGAYSIYGVGLLEQAISAAELVADKIRTEVEEEDEISRKYVCL